MTTGLYSPLLNIHRSGVLINIQHYMLGIWPVSRDTDAVSAHILCTPYNYAPVCILHAKPHIECLCLLGVTVTCALGRMNFACYCGNTGVERIPPSPLSPHSPPPPKKKEKEKKKRVSVERYPWRRNFSLCSCRVSNPRPFDLESGTLPLS